MPAQTGRFMKHIISQVDIVSKINLDYGGKLLGYRPSVNTHFDNPTDESVAVLMTATWQNMQEHRRSMNDSSNGRASAKGNVPPHVGGRSFHKGG